MKKDALLYLIIGLLGGSLLTVIFSRYSFNSNMTGMMQMMGFRNNMMENEERFDGDERGMMNMGSSMDQMMQSMTGKTGDEFDRSFMEAMIVHHQGAIEIATQAKQNANHPEIMKMADDIISAQTGEINMMRDWQNQWGL